MLMRVCYIGKEYEGIDFSKKVIDRYSIGKVLKANKEFNPDLFHVIGLPLSLALAKMLTKKKFVVTLEDIPSNPITRTFLSFCDGVIVPTKYHCEKVGVKENKKVVIPIPIQAGGDSRNRELILDCTGNTNMERAMTLLGNEFSLYELTRDIGLMKEAEVVFVGSYKNIPELQKAMSMGKAVIALDTDGLSDYVNHKENGILTEDEPSKIASKLVQILKDDRLRHKIVENAEKSARSWDFEHVKRKLERFYTYILESS
jgi:hypothetical protein